MFFFILDHRALCKIDIHFQSSLWHYSKYFYKHSIRQHRLDMLFLGNINFTLLIRLINKNFGMVWHLTNQILNLLLSLIYYETFWNFSSVTDDLT